MQTDDFGTWHRDELVNQIDNMTPLVGVAAAVSAYLRLNTATDAQVIRAREAGATWEQIANAAGMTRSAAWQRWHILTETLEADGTTTVN